MLIRPATDADNAAIWQILEPVIRAGDTYALPREMSQADAVAFWRTASHETFVAIVDGEPVGTYYLKANRQGGGAHVANCGYVTSITHTRRGIAEAMCRHSLEQARNRGFRAMQFNFVVASNAHAVRLWQRLGFNIVGTLPHAFLHPGLGLVDALVMFREL